MYKEEPYILTSSLGKVIVSTENFIFGKSVIQLSLIHIYTAVVHTLNLLRKEEHYDRLYCVMSTANLQNNNFPHVIP